MHVSRPLKILPISSTNCCTIKFTIVGKLSSGLKILWTAPDCISIVKTIITLHKTCRSVRSKQTRVFLYVFESCPLAKKRRNRLWNLLFSIIFASWSELWFSYYWIVIVSRGSLSYLIRPYKYLYESLRLLSTVLHSV